MPIKPTPIKIEEIQDGHQKGGTKETHESYGMISISRISIGGDDRRQAMFGSDATHDHLIAIRVRTGGERVRNLNHDWYHVNGPEVLDVWLTEAQYA